jgi:TonB family protein
MTRRWWGGPGLSLLLHAALLAALLYVAARPSPVAATDTGAATPIKMVYVARIGLPGSGSGTPDAAKPRMMRAPETAPIQLVPPKSLTNAEPPPVATVPAITAERVDVLPGAPMPLDGTTVGRGLGGRAGIGNGPGLGPGAGPGIDDVYTAGNGGVSNPSLIHEVKPNYTIDAMRGKVQGVVIMEVTVLANGTVDPASIRITRSLEPGLDREATMAVREWRFRPSQLLGRPVASRVIVELGFTLR